MIAAALFLCVRLTQVAARPGRSIVHHIVKRGNIHTYLLGPSRVVAGELSPFTERRVCRNGSVECINQFCHRDFIEIDSLRWSHID